MNKVVRIGDTEIGLGRYVDVWSWLVKSALDKVDVTFPTGEKVNVYYNGKNIILECGGHEVESIKVYDESKLGYRIARVTKDVVEGDLKVMHADGSYRTEKLTLRDGKVELSYASMGTDTIEETFKKLSELGFSLW